MATARCWYNKGPHWLSAGALFYRNFPLADYELYKLKSKLELFCIFWPLILKNFVGIHLFQILVTCLEIMRELPDVKESTIKPYNKQLITLERSVDLTLA